MLMSLCFKLSFFALNSLNHSAFLSCSFSLSHVLHQNYLLSLAFGFSLLIFLTPFNYFLILDTHSTDIILVHSLHISFQFCYFYMESLFQLFYHCSSSFFLYAILRFMFLIFFFPLYLTSLVTF